MADITLSKAVRSNLLSLQNTSNLLAKTQERLATGLRVNSALDNPTNFFTASSLNSRANDLGRLLDSISNANQTIEEADNGLTAITKLVESAQATARQALQTSATIETTTAATAGAATGTGFSALDVSGTAASATAGTVTGTGFSAVTVAGATAGSTSFTFGSSTGAFDGVDDAITFDVVVDGGGTQNISIAQADVAAVGNNDNTIDDADELAAILSSKITGATATNNAGTITIASDTTGASSSIAFSNFAVVDTNTSGFTDNTGLSSATSGTGTAADSITFSIAVDGGGTQNVTIDNAAVAAVGNNDGVIDDTTELAAILNAQITGATASDDGNGEIQIVSDTTGATSSVAISSFSENVTGGATGLSDLSDTGSAATTNDSVSFTVTLDGGTAQNITIDAATVSSYNTANSTTLDASALTAQNVADLINDQLSGTATTATVSGGNLVLTSSTTGASSSVAIGTITSSVSGGSVGTFSSTAGAAASTATTTNPKRDEFVDTYNSLLTQIDDLAKDAGFNGVNLLSGDDLSVLFNEDGSSKLDISGVTFDSAGLSLSAVASGGFDSNTSINTTLDTLSSAIDTLRAQASKFGSNLSVVETRQNFTKETINTLETGAANLTLADSNEEAANLLALQTRQQLSSTSLSLASQADQQVLRLF
ncbi:MAG: flagellin [Tepidamorphaceae bacterium]